MSTFKILSVFFYLSLCGIKANYLKAMGRFLQMQPKQNLILFEHLCWPRKDINDFLKHLPSSSGTFNKTSKILETNGKDLFILVDLSCPSAKDFLLSVNHEDPVPLFGFPYKWIIFLDDVFDLPINLNIFLNSRVFLFEKRDSFYVYSPFRIENTRKYIYNEVAFWNNNDFQFVNQISDYHNRSNQHRMTLPISIVLIFNESRQHLHDGRQLSKDSLSKANFVLVMHMVEILNCTFELIIQRTWGTKSKNSTKFDGLLGDLQTKRAELGGTVSFMAADRVTFVDYVSQPINTLGKFIFRAPSLSKVKNILTMPFDTWVWLSLFMLLVIIFFFILIIVKWEWSQNRDHSEYEKSMDHIMKPGILDVLQLEIGAVCQQGSEAEPRVVSGKIITFLLFLAFLFFYTAYSAYIVALLQTTSKSINNLQSLLDSGMTLGIDNAPYSKYTSSKQTGLLRERVLKKIFSNGNKDQVYTPDEGVRRLRHNFFAFHSETNTIYRLIADTFLEGEKCGLAEVEYWLETYPYMTIRKHSAYKEIVKIGYSRLREHGMQKRNYKKFYTEKPKCTNSGAVFRSVSLLDCYFAFVCFGTGSSIAVIILFLEHLHLRAFKTTNHIQKM